MTEAIDTRIGTVDLPVRLERARYFRELTYVEWPALVAGPLKPSTLAAMAAAAPARSIGLVAPWVLTHRQPPKAAKLWDHDASVGDFRDSTHGRAALVAFKSAIVELDAGFAVFPSPPVFAASAANRDQLKRFFGEIATEEAVGATRVWIPDGLWTLRTAITFAAELGVVCAFDPLVRDPGQQPEMFYDLDVTQLYLRIAGLGHAGPLRPERIDELISLLETYVGIPATIAFDSPVAWKDARTLKKALEGLA